MFTLIKVNLLPLLRCTTIHTVVTITNTRAAITATTTTTDTIMTIFLFDFAPSVEEPTSDVLVVSCTVTGVVGFCAAVVLWLSLLLVGTPLVVVISVLGVVV